MAAEITSKLPTGRRGTDPLGVARRAVEAALAAAPSVDLSWIVPPPSNEGWTLAPDALRFLSALVPILKPRHILEMGSGLSTRVLARVGTGQQPRCVISSVDHDPQFGPIAAADYARQVATSGIAKFQIAPVVARECGGKILPVYFMNPAKLASKRSPDLVVIDGPPVNLGGREGTLYQVMELARPGTLVLLDDANRASELAAVAHWRETLGDAIAVTKLPGFAKGMAAIIVREPVKIADLWQRRTAATARDIEATIPTGERFILIDQQTLGFDVVAGRAAVPFLEKEGYYWGLPENDAAAMAELMRQQINGIHHVVIAWQAFWWFETYPDFHRHLREQARCVLENDRLVIFELKNLAANERG